MRTYLTDFFEEFSYPAEAREALLGDYGRIIADGGRRLKFEGFLQAYASDRKLNLTALYPHMAELSAEAGVHAYTGNLLLFACLSETLHRYYRDEGIEETVWHASMCDLKWKLDECRCVYGIWGTFVPTWYDGFFDMTRFGFLKLQFEIRPFGSHYEKKGILLTPESRVLNTHIPRTGQRLDPADVQKSYEHGGRFFRERFGVDPVVFVCDSWLLYPRNREVLSPDSNLYAFLSGFDIIRSREFSDYREVWRLFDRNYEGDVEKLPQDTSFRRAYAEWIRKGERTGAAYGVHIP